MTVIKAFSGLLGATTTANEVRTGVVIADVGVGLPCSWVIHCFSYPWMGPVRTGSSARCWDESLVIRGHLGGELLDGGSQGLNILSLGLVGSREDSGL